MSLISQTLMRPHLNRIHRALLVAHVCRDPIIVRQTCRCCLGDPRPTILSYHPPHRVEFFGDRQTPNVTAPATHGRTRTSSSNAPPVPLRRNLRLERLESSLSSLQPQVTDSIFYRN